MTLALILSFEFTVEKTHCKYHGLRVRNQARGDLAKLMAGSDCGGGGAGGSKEAGTAVQPREHRHHYVTTAVYGNNAGEGCVAPSLYAPPQLVLTRSVVRLSYSKHRIFQFLAPQLMRKNRNTSVINHFDGNY